MIMIDVLEFGRARTSIWIYFAISIPVRWVNAFSFRLLKSDWWKNVGKNAQTVF